MSVAQPGLALVRLDALPDPGAVVVEVEIGGAPAALIVTRRGDRVAAFRNRCAHADYPLQRADGSILVQESRFMVCATHGASYTLEDGACAGGPCNGKSLERIPVGIRDDVVITL
jgi:nitrite reductase/ring-hydroxylating ferredoxin subunit